MDRRIQKTEAAIQAAYFSMLNRKDNSRITISEIAREANIDRKTFYLHYSSVEDIVVRFGEKKNQELLMALEEIDFFKQPFNIKSFFSVLNTAIESDLDLYSLVALNDSMDFFWLHIQEMMVSTLKNIYSNQTNLSNEQFDIYTRFISSGLISIYKSWLKKDILITLEELGTIANEVSAFGIHNIFPASDSLK